MTLLLEVKLKFQVKLVEHYSYFINYSYFMQIYKSYAFDIQLNRLKYLVKIVFV